MVTAKVMWRRGIGIVYVAITLPPLMGFASLAVDFGRVQVAKTELRRACDAAAIYGSSGLSDGTAAAKAIQSAGENTVDGTPMMVLSTDVTTGNWTSPTFTAAGTPINAIRIITGRTAARGTAIPLLFAQAIGIRSCDINTSSVVYAPTSTGNGYGFFATGTVLLQNGPIVVDSYNSSVNQYSSTTAESKASVATNSGITTNNVTVDGSLQAGPGQTISHQNGTLTVTGSTTSLTASKTFATPTLPGTYTSLSNVNVSSGATYTLGTAGTTTTYYATSFNVPSSSTLTISGPVVLYVNGNFEVDGTMNVLNNLPANFTVEQMSSSGVTFNGSHNIYAHVYAPNSPLNMNTAMNYFGSIVVGQMNISGQIKLHDDETDGAASGSSGVPAIVK